MENCVHCLIVPGTTEDHIFPRSWYPDSTDPNMPKRSVPACEKCNGKLGGIELKLRRLLALCVSPSKVEACGIQKRVLRELGVGIDPRLLKPEELRIRKALKQKILNQAEPYKPGKGYYPGLGPHLGAPLEEQMTIPVPIDLLIPFFSKVIRGLEYHYEKRYIEDDYELDIHEAVEVVPLDIEKIFNMNSPDMWGPGFIVRRSFAGDDKKSILYRIRIWDTLEAYATILPQYAKHTRT